MMRKFLQPSALIVALLVSGVAQAQTVPGTAKFSWILPTTGCTVGVTPCDKKPLIGSAALTSVQVFVSTSPIPDSPTTAPTSTLAAGATTTNISMTVTNGSTIYGRFRVCTASMCSDLSAESGKPIKLDVKPDVPTSVTIEIQVGA